MKASTVLVVVVVVGLAVAAFVLSIRDAPLFDFDAVELAKKWQTSGGDSFGPRDVTCSDCAADCEKDGPLRRITLRRGGRCQITVKPSDSTLRRGMLRIEKGQAAVAGLLYRLDDGGAMDVPDFNLSCVGPGRRIPDCCPNDSEPPDGCDKQRLERELQFTEHGGQFSLACTAPAGCRMVFPAE